MIKKNIIANYVGQGWSVLMNVAFVPIYIKYLGIEAYGIIGLYAMLQVWLRLLDMGMTQTLSREIAISGYTVNKSRYIKDLLRSIEIVAFILAAIFFIVMFIISGWITKDWLSIEYLKPEDVINAIIIMAGVAAVRFIENIYHSSLIGLQRQVLLNVINIIMATLRGVGSVLVLILVAPSIEVFFMWQGFVSILSLMILAISTYKSIPHYSYYGKLSITILKKISHFAGGVMLITLLSILLTQVDKILLSSLLPLSSFGYYSLATVVASSLFMIVKPITQAWYPRICQMISNGNDRGVYRIFHLGAQSISVVSGTMAIIVVLYSKDILELWTQDEQLATNVSPILSLLTAGNFLHSLMWVPYQTQLAYGWTSLAIKINIYTIIIFIPTIYILSINWGMKGAALGWVLINLSYVLVGAHLMHRKILTSEKYNWYLYDIMIPLTAILSIAVSSKLLFSFEQASELLQIIFIAALCTLTMLIALLTVTDLRRIVLVELIKQIAKYK